MIILFLILLLKLNFLYSELSSNYNRIFNYFSNYFVEYNIFSKNLIELPFTPLSEYLSSNERILLYNQYKKEVKDYLYYFLFEFNTSFRYNNIIKRNSTNYFI